jgi:hypothetical protein
MSFAVKGSTTLVCDPEVIKKVAKQMGFKVKEKAKIRSHDVEANRVFDLVLVNENSSDKQYDVGVSFAKDNKTAEFVYDKWDKTVEEQLGENCSKFKNKCAVEQIRGNDPEYSHMSYDQYFEHFCEWDMDGGLVYNGYDSEPWTEEDN